MRISSSMNRTGLFFGFLAVFLLIIGAAIATLTWLDDLQKKDCTCAADANTRFIRFMCYYVIFMGIFGIIMVGSVSRGFKVPEGLRRFQSIMSFVNTVLVITFIVIGLKYIKALFEKKCACALDDPRRKVFQAWIWMYVALYAIMVVAAVISIILLLTLLSRRKN